MLTVMKIFINISTYHEITKVSKIDPSYSIFTWFFKFIRVKFKLFRTKLYLSKKKLTIHGRKCWGELWKFQYSRLFAYSNGIQDQCIFSDFGGIFGFSLGISMISFFTCFQWLYGWIVRTLTCKDLISTFPVQNFEKRNFTNILLNL